MSTDPLLSPFRLKRRTLRNRIVSTSHEPAYAEQGNPRAGCRPLLQPKAVSSFRIGDAVAGRNIHAAMLDARRLALTI